LIPITYFNIPQLGTSSKYCDWRRIEGVGEKGDKEEISFLSSPSPYSLLLTPNS
jgi:hypothetical protein